MCVEIGTRSSAGVPVGRQEIAMFVLDAGADKDMQKCSMKNATAKFHIHGMSSTPPCDTSSDVTRHVGYLELP